MPSLAQDAQLLKLLFQYGLIPSHAIINWADAQIISLSSPPAQLIELSTTPDSRTADLLSHLGALAADADYWEAFRAVLGFVAEAVSSHRETAVQSANKLYCFVVTTGPARSMPFDLPEDLQFLYRFLNDWDVAHTGIRGEPNALLEQFITRLQSFERFKRVPSGLVLEGRTSREWPIGFAPKTDAKDL